MIPIILITAMVLSPTPVLIITEVQVHGESHIKIFNPGTEDLDISGFRLRKKTASGRESSIRVFPKESTITAGGYFTWANSKNNHHLKIEADVWSKTGISDNNNIALVSPEGDILDSVAWGKGDNQFLSGKPIPNPSKDQIIRRISSDEKYQITGDNLSDFELYPGIKSDISESEFIQTWTGENSKTSPIIIGVGVAILSLLSILILRRAIYGRA